LIVYGYLMHLMFTALATNRVKAHQGRGRDYNMLILIGAMLAAPSPFFIDMAVRFAFGLGQYSTIELVFLVVGVGVAVTPGVINMRKILRAGGLDHNV